MKLNIRKVGVIGAGQMGNGIAHVCALAGFPVLLNDVAPDRIKSEAPDRTFEPVVIPPSKPPDPTDESLRVQPQPQGNPKGP